MATDQELLASYVRDRSQEAFGELVARHLDLVYASARRQVGNEALAQDVTQAVFIMLDKKAATLRTDVILPAWLLTATWYACKNAMRKEHRRRIHERSASLMRRETGDESALPDPQIGGVLDEALMSLRESDRAAVVMHYLQGQTFNEVAAALHTTPEAARKRADRALEKLRMQFARQGMDLAAPAAVAPYLISAASTKAPAAMLAAVTSGMTGAAASGSVAAVALADATAKTMSAVAGAKLAAVVAAAMLLIASAGAAVYATTSGWRVARAGPAPTALASTNLSASTLVPVDLNAGDRAAGADRVVFPNTLIAPIAATNARPYTFGDDANVKRQPDGGPTPFIASVGPSLMPGMRGWSIPVTSYWRGKRVEISVYLRTQDVRESTGVNAGVFGPQNKLLVGDVNGPPLRIAGTQDWTRMTSVLDVPADAERIGFGIGLWGAGRVWLDSFAMQTVGQDVPVTSDERWNLETQFPSKYRLVSDPSQPRGGHASARLESPGDGGAATSGEWAKLMRAERAMDALRGKRLRIKAMMKCENLTGGAGVFASAGRYEAQVKHSQKESKHDLPLTGTSGWEAYATTLAVPTDSEVLEYGVRLEGTGTLWIDDITVEVVP